MGRRRPHHRPAASQQHMTAEPLGHAGGYRRWRRPWLTAAKTEMSATAASGSRKPVQDWGTPPWRCEQWYEQWYL